MNRPFALAAVMAVGLSLAACGSPTASGDPATDVHQLVADGATLLDVRSQAEFDSGHLEGATLVPVDELASRMGEVPRDRPVVVYCRSGARSGRAAGMLRGAGYEVHDLGSIDNW